MPSKYKKIVCLPAEVNTQRKIYLDHIPQSLETQQALNRLCKEYKDILLLHQGYRDHTKLYAMDTDRGDHPPFTQKPYTLP